MAGLTENNANDDNSNGNESSTVKANNERLQAEPNDEEEPSLLSATTRQKLHVQQGVLRMILDAMTTESQCLDLSRKQLKVIPEELLQIHSLKYLYLEGNQLVSLPENFFDCLPNLEWLDLRQNYLASIPSTYIGRHKHLKNVLLEGNQLRTLPLELGLVSTLNGLNIANNPLEFPPPEIIEGGTQHILSFFREMLRAKSQGRVLPDFQGHPLGDQSMTRAVARLNKTLVLLWSRLFTRTRALFRRTRALVMLWSTRG